MLKKFLQNKFVSGFFFINFFPQDERSFVGGWVTTSLQKIILTYNREIISKTFSRWIPKVHSASIKALIVPPDVFDREEGWLSSGSKVGSGAKYLRGWVMKSSVERFSTNIQPVERKIGTVWARRKVKTFHKYNKFHIDID